jgi:hypothetical protein
METLRCEGRPKRKPSSTLHGLVLTPKTAKRRPRHFDKEEWSAIKEEIGSLLVAEPTRRTCRPG